MKGEHEVNKRLIKQIIQLAMCLTLAFSLVACAKEESKEIEKTIEIIDHANREVVFDKPVTKIVSGYYISSYACLALGLSDQLVGIEMKSDTRPIYKMVNESLLDLPQVGSMKSLNIEAIVATQPELVIIPLKLKDQAETLTDLGIKVLVVEPETHDQLVEMIQMIGAVTGKQKEAKSLVDYYTNQVSKMDLRQTEDKQNVYIGSNSSYLETAPASMYQNYLIEVAGGNNVAKTIEGDYWTQVSYESLISMNPDMMIIPSGAKYSVEDILNDEQLLSLTAVKNKKVYKMPGGIEEWDSPVPSGILGSMWLSSLLNADKYSHDDFVKDVKNFYQTFYGFEVDTSLIK